LVDAWRNSELSATEFAAQRKLSARTLTWWKWHLGSSSAKPKLIPLEIIAAEDQTSDLHAEWELKSSSGHVLRVVGAINDEDLAAILHAMSRTGGTR
jgi:hypothetical protein